MESLTAWTQTHGGRKFDFINLDKNDYEIDEIAHALSNLCRWTGHTNDFYSVAEHSVLVSLLVPPEFALWGLLHDAAEAYINDLARPVKKLFPGYEALEERILRGVSEKYGLIYPPPKEVKVIDTAILVSEKYQVFDHDIPWGWEHTVMPIKIKIQFLIPREAKGFFLRRYYELTS